MRYGHYFLSQTGVNIDRITQPDVSKGVNKLIYLGNSVNTAHSEYLKQIGECNLVVHSLLFNT